MLLNMTRATRLLTVRGRCELDMKLEPGRYEVDCWGQWLAVHLGEVHVNSSGPPVRSLQISQVDHDFAGVRALSAAMGTSDAVLRFRRPTDGLQGLLEIEGAVSSFVAEGQFEGQSPTDWFVCELGVGGEVVGTIRAFEPRVIGGPRRLQMELTESLEDLLAGALTDGRGVLVRSS